MNYFAGVDIGGMSIKIGIVNEKGSIIAESYFSTEKEEIDLTIEKILNEINVLEKKNKIYIKAIGIGIPGVTNTYDGTVVSAVNLGWKNIKLVEEFKKKKDIKVVILNDANAAAYGEYIFGFKHNKINSFVLITLGTGIGSGIIINDDLYLGFGSAAGELGHMTIKEGGIKCNCGNFGCYEKYASASALMKQIKNACKKNKNSILAKMCKDENSYSGKIVFEALKKKCDVAKDVIEKYSDYVSAGLISIVNTIHPEFISIGGGVSNAGEILINAIQKRIDEYIEKSGFYPKIKIIKANLMNKAGIVGAAAFAMKYE